MTDYNLIAKAAGTEPKNAMLAAVKKLWPLMRDEKKILIIAFIAIIVNSLLTLFAPLLMAHVINTYFINKDFHGVLVYSGILLGMYLLALGASYAQTRLMGGIGQRVLFNLRNAVFNKLQELPVAFFNQNKAGDLISRINNDTDKLNQFFSQSLMQFIGSIFIMIGAGIFLLVLNIRLGGAALIPAALIIIITIATAAWVKRKNALSMRALGGLSAEIQESLMNFKVVVAFNRRDYFREHFEEANQKNYETSIGAGIANNTLTPFYGWGGNLGQLVVIAYGLFLILQGQFTLGLLVGFLIYVNNFYNPLRQLASLWANFQTALAGWDRISDILSLKTDLVVIDSVKDAEGAVKKIVSKEIADSILAFDHVFFRYAAGKDVLHDISFSLEKGKTYALVGPTGGGKTTTASLMARLYDATEGTVYLDGKDIRTYDAAARTKKIGFILQDPFLFTGTVRDNIIYSNEQYKDHSNDQLEAVIKKEGLEKLLARFDKGLDTPVLSSGDAISLGQKQLIVFIRAVLRNPALLILDEATANIDTVTEGLLEEILKQLPKETTRVIIAHRLNTIENADVIFFVNSGTITRAGSMQQAVDMLLHGKRQS
ncbi:MAG TPA: ABC transporter ATP-binding protein [Candidatus Paceibacterota bacterium]